MLPQWVLNEPNTTQVVLPVQWKAREPCTTWCPHSGVGITGEPDGVVTCGMEGVTTEPQPSQVAGEGMAGKGGGQPGAENRCRHSFKRRSSHKAVHAEPRRSTTMSCRINGATVAR